MIELVRTTAKNQDFVALVKELDASLADADGDEHAFYNQFNSIRELDHVVVAYAEGKPAACGAIKAFEKNRMEVKRMYTRPELRGSGVASAVLKELEKWSTVLGAKACVLETGINQKTAIHFYKKMGYVSIKNYGQYENVKNSFCFEKLLT